MKNKWRGLSGASGDSVLLIFVRLVTILLGMITTRIVAEKLGLTDYGTYSQVMLLVSSIASLTILGFADGANYFFHQIQAERERMYYVNTILALQYIIGILVGAVLFIAVDPIVWYFNNEALRKMIIFAAFLPVLQNSISVLQVLFVAIGKAKAIAIRNLLISLVRLMLFSVVCFFLKSIALLFAATLLMDLAQITYFVIVLRRNRCNISLRKCSLKLTGKIFSYCIPMAVFLVVSSLTRDCDKYVISAFTDTETLAVYTNASRMLPFDIVMSAFCTVLLPYITRYITEEKYENAQNLYRKFLELAYITTSVFAGCAVAVAPNLMTLLYSEKYIAGLDIFVVYIFVDILRFTNITLLLSASGQTKKLMWIAVSGLTCNLVLDIMLFRLFGIVGPAIATVIVTALMGIIILALSAKSIHTNLSGLFDFRYLILFVIQFTILTFGFSRVNSFLYTKLHYLWGILIIAPVYLLIFLLLTWKRLRNCFTEIGIYKLHD